MRLTKGEKIFQWFLIVIITMLCIVMVYPFLHVLSISLSTPAEALRPGIHLYPKEISLFAWERVLSTDSIWRAFGITVFRTVVGTLLSLVFMSMAAYPLSRKYLPHRGYYTTFIIITMFFGGGLIPTYLLIKSLGLINSVWVYIIPGLVSTFSMLILRNFFMGIPMELEDSAKIDGANDIRILVQIIVPLSAPVLATLALWAAVAHWNNWFDAMLYMQDKTKITLQLLLRRLVIANMGDPMMPVPTEEEDPAMVKAAIIMFTALPILVVYPFLQRFFVKGVMVGSLKG
ncbi:carbohydrate ABC transporter permease [Paenibacillus prosopidis]|uniref:Putative aldouronate transport system permease protein n=1 Tax=Paenibacillus prosopidis TaxID=630520 RepID=A0A368W1Y1_9BACL|nr:carbohydrate ABC transporter permease [Paenibacillus prosopidis]RCW48479.1 putative aldouronate transport system permease protein [Paenibacillus prosopidis]